MATVRFAAEPDGDALESEDLQSEQSCQWYQETYPCLRGVFTRIDAAQVIVWHRGEARVPGVYRFVCCLLLAGISIRGLT